MENPMDTYSPTYEERFLKEIDAEWNSLYDPNDTIDSLLNKNNPKSVNVEERSNQKYEMHIQSK